MCSLGDRLASAALVDAATGEESYTVMADALAGSAARFLPATMADVARYLYAVEFSRNCSASTLGALCYDVPAAPTPAQRLVLGTASPAVFIERMYLHPRTHSGPDVAETVLPWLVHVRRGRKW